MIRTLSANEVAKHDGPDSCWVIIYGQVYDVTDFLSQHPGGSQTILQVAGQDATDEFDPIHPAGTLEEYLPKEAKVGQLDASTAAPPKERITPQSQEPHGALLHDLENALNLDDLEELATKRISRKAWAYYFSAADDLISKKLNDESYRSILLRPRVFVDCEKCDTSTTIIGNSVASPVYVSPAAAAGLVHAQGEVGIAHACAKFGSLHMISHNASMTPEKIVQDAPPGQVFAWQIYVQTDRQKSERMLSRINKLSDKIKFIVLTLDAPVPGKREHDQRPQAVQDQSATNAAKRSRSKQPKAGGIGSKLFQGTASDLTWKMTLPWLAKHTALPIVLKGVQTHEDAQLATAFAPQVKGIIVSNHGGRQLDTAPPAVLTLLEIRRHCPEVFSKIEVLVDGGIRRGTDVVKALCLGARGVGIGRAALWGLGAGGTEGVMRTLQILQAELETAMRLLGVDRISDLNPSQINTRAIDHWVYEESKSTQTSRISKL